MQPEAVLDFIGYLKYSRIVINVKDRRDENEYVRANGSVPGEVAVTLGILEATQKEQNRVETGWARN